MNSHHAAQLDEKIKNDPALRVIRTPKSKADFPIVAEEIWELYREDYHLAIRDIVQILDCEAAWVYKNIPQHVEHIFLNKYMRNLIYNYRDSARGDSYLRDYYYFSQIAFERWLEENTTAQIKTILMDNRELTTEQTSSISPPSFNNRKEHSPVLIHSPIPKRFCSMRTIQREMGIGTGVSAYRHLFKIGAVKYIIAGSLVRYSPAVLTRTVKENQILLWADEAKES